MLHVPQCDHVFLPFQKFGSDGLFTGEVTSFDGTYYKVTYEDGDTEEYNDGEMEKIVLTGEGCDDEYEYGCNDESKFSMSPDIRSTNSNISIANGNNEEVDTIQDETIENVKKQGTVQLERIKTESQKTCDDQENEPAREDDAHHAPIHRTKRLKKPMTTKVSPRRNTAKETKKHQTDAKMYAGENASGKNATVLPKKCKETRMPPDSHCLKKQCTDGLLSDTNKTTESEKYKAHNNGNGACLLYTSPSPRDGLLSRMPSSA